MSVKLVAKFAVFGFSLRRSSLAAIYALRPPEVYAGCYWRGTQKRDARVPNLNLLRKSHRIFKMFSHFFTNSEYHLALITTI
jgi:hypothetical protein